ncbi:GNAT family N-acetyltransferase [Streptosporangium sp. NPDC049046]|uniref:GNAT family N-acetyltransferase n=1 Tax=unclassified Streptosporangium TaxID=2632669 RepID=UPI0034361390
MLRIGKLTPADRPRWETLFRGYNDFYGRTLPPQLYDRAWDEFREGVRMHALGAKLDGELVGIAHFLIHSSTTALDVCHLQDLFVAPQARSEGAGRALIEAVTEWASARDCSRVYWSTKETDTEARRLYDKVAVNRGFILYQIDLQPEAGRPGVAP